LHAIGSQELDHTLIDLNRCGIPLLEIVSEPDMSSPQEAYEYLVELKKILRWVGASNCDMEKGELRCDVNISLKPKGQSELGQKVEIKNLNSFKAVKDALAYEIERQKELCSRGERISQDTRLWNEKEQKTVFMRSKEMAHDYRYFPEPDLPPLKLKSEYIKEIKERIGLMPLELKKMYIEKYSLTSFEAESLSSDKDINLYFQKILNLNPDKKTLKNAINLITGVLFSKLNELKIKESEIEKSMPGEKLFEIAVLLSQNKISQSAAKKVFELCWDSEKKPSTIVQEEGLYQVNDDTEIEKWVKEAVEFNKKAYDDFKKGNEKASGPIVGYVMKKSKGKANPALVNEILKKI
jgi:aspartyl-tRNA(Asn)/glutamyl-tRNA(Gln) amidotransferase subunit B